MKNIRPERSTRQGTDTRAATTTPARRSTRLAIDCGGAAADAADGSARQRSQDRVDARRAFDMRRGMYADQAQAI